MRQAGSRTATRGALEVRADVQRLDHVGDLEDAPQRPRGGTRRKALAPPRQPPVGVDGSEREPGRIHEADPAAGPRRRPIASAIRLVQDADAAREAVAMSSSPSTIERRRRRRRALHGKRLHRPRQTTGMGSAVPAVGSCVLLRLPAALPLRRRIRRTPGEPHRIRRSASAARPARPRRRSRRPSATMAGLTRSAARRWPRSSATSSGTGSARHRSRARPGRDRERTSEAAVAPAPAALHGSGDFR